MDLKVSADVREHGDVRVVEFGGEIDVYTAPVIKETLVGLVDGGAYKMVVNMQNVRYIDSTGLGVLIGVLKRVREHGGSVHLVCTDTHVCKVFDITGLRTILPIFEEESAAVEAFR